MKCYVGKQLIQERLPDLMSDESRVSVGVPQKVCFPTCEDDVRSIVKEASRQAVPLTIIGGQTGITGGSVPIDDCIAVCFSEMNKIVRIEKNRDGAPVLICEPGVTLEKIAEFLENPGAWPYAVEGSDTLSSRQWFYPPDPTEMTAQLGGTVATNASGARSFRFGPTRTFIEVISMILANGDTVTIRRNDPKPQAALFSFSSDQGTEFIVPKPAYRIAGAKNSSGYYSDPGMALIDLFIGSEGTLAVFTAIGIRLLPKPDFIAGLSFFPDRQAAFGFASFLRGEKQVAAIEYFDESALSFLDRERAALPCAIPHSPADGSNAVYWEWREEDSGAFADHMDGWENLLTRHGSSFENTWSGFDAKEMAQLKSFRHCVPEAINNAIAKFKRNCPGLRKVSTDTALPESRFKQTFDSYLQEVLATGLEHVIFGHLGDFHLHINFIPHDAEEYSLAKQAYENLMTMTISAKGTVSAEHGIGKLKIDYLAAMYGRHAILEMMKIKTALDPGWLLNRGNLFAFPP